MLESLNYSFRNPKNIIWVIYRIKQLRNYKKKHGVLRGPQLDKQRWRARLGILRVNSESYTNRKREVTLYGDKEPLWPGKLSKSCTKLSPITDISTAFRRFPTSKNSLTLTQEYGKQQSAKRQYNSQQVGCHITHVWSCVLRTFIRHTVTFSACKR